MECFLISPWKPSLKKKAFFEEKKDAKKISLTKSKTTQSKRRTAEFSEKKTQENLKQWVT